MHKRKVIVFVILAFLGAGLAVFLLTRDSGPPVVVNGNFSAKDVAQIKSAVRRELWRAVFPNFSWETVEASPGAMKKALNSHVATIEPMGANLPVEVGESNSNLRQTSAVAIMSPTGSSNSWDELHSIYFLTNGPSGWVCHRGFTAGWTSYSPLLQ
jgi:hypothetical protein